MPVLPSVVSTFTGCSLHARILSCSAKQQPGLLHHAAFRAYNPLAQVLSAIVLQPYSAICQQQPS